MLSSCLDEGPIKAITVKSGIDSGLRFANVTEKLFEQVNLSRLIENLKLANIIVLSR